MTRLMSRYTLRSSFGGLRTVMDAIDQDKVASWVGRGLKVTRSSRRPGRPGENNRMMMMMMTRELFIPRHAREGVLQPYARLRGRTVGGVGISEANLHKSKSCEH